MSEDLRTVKGMHDIIGADLAKMNHVENLFFEAATRYGFIRVKTPMLEYAELYRKSAEFNEEKCYVLSDAQGRKLVLRSDPDAPLARLVATNFRQYPRPIRLVTCGSVFRSWNPKRREFRMFCVSTFGIKEPSADAEILRLIADVVEAVGFSEYRVEYNNLQFYKKILASVGANPVQTLHHLRFAKNIESAEAILFANGVDKVANDALLSLLTCTDPSKALCTLDSVANIFPEIIPEMQDVIAFAVALSSYGIVNTALNLANLHGTGFYSWITFRILPKVGSKEIGDGGRFDEMLSSLESCPMPATGVGVGIERFIGLMADNKCGYRWPTPPKGVLVSYMDNSLTTVIRPILHSLRAQGRLVEEELIERKHRHSVHYAESKAYYAVVFVSRSVDSFDKYVITVDLLSTKNTLVYETGDLLDVLSRI